MKNIIFLYMLWLFVPAYLQGQTTAIEFQKLRDKVAQKKEYNYALRLDIFKENASSPTQSTTCQSISKNGKTYFKMDKIECVSEKGLTVVINSDEHYVLLASAFSETTNAMQSPDALLKNIANSGYKMVLGKSKDGKNSLKAVSEDGLHTLSEVIYDSNYNIEKSITHYDPEYTNYLLNEVEDGTSRLEVSISNLPLVEAPLKLSDVIKVGKTYTLSPKYSKFKFYNQLSAQGK